MILKSVLRCSGNPKELGRQKPRWTGIQQPPVAWNSRKFPFAKAGDGGRIATAVAQPSGGCLTKGEELNISGSTMPSAIRLSCPLLLRLLDNPRAAGAAPFLRGNCSPVCMKKKRLPAVSKIPISWLEWVCESMNENPVKRKGGLAAVFLSTCRDDVRRICWRLLHPATA